ncbi:MAG: hypothetical protein AAB372_01290 [Patescibacteria group bacterium]
MHLSNTVRVGISIAVGALFFFILSATMDLDNWWYLSGGRLISEQHDVPRLDNASFVVQNFPIIDHEWLPNWLLWLAWSNDLWVLAVLVATACASIPFIVWIFRARSWVDIWIIVCAVASMIFFVSMRNYLISFALFFVVSEILRMRYEVGAVSKYFLFMPIIFFLWANTHGGFVIGLVLWVVYVGTYYGLERQRDYAWQDFLIFFISVALTFVNPYGWRLYEEVIGANVSRAVLGYIKEWRPGFEIVSFFGAFFVGLVMSVCVLWRKRVRPIIIAPVVLFFIFFMKLARMGPFFYLISIPLLFSVSEDIRPHISRKILSILFFGVFVYITFFIVTLERPPLPSAQAVESLRNTDRGNTWNDFEWGSVLRFYIPEKKIFIDSRMGRWADARGVSVLQTYADVLTVPQYWKKVFYDYNIDTVFLARRIDDGGKNFVERWFAFAEYSPDVDLERELIRDDWEVVYQDSTAIVLQYRGKGICEEYGR